MSFAFILLDFGFEFLSFLGELSRKRLEFLKLLLVNSQRGYLLFPVFQFFDEKVVSFGDFGNFAVHTRFEMNVILPRFIDFSRKCILLPNHFVQMTHADFGHDGLFLVAFENCRDAGILAGFFADVIDDIHHRILIPPLGILDTFDLSTHHLNQNCKERRTMIGPEG
jgi:hypothetical protein